MAQPATQDSLHTISVARGGFTAARTSGCGQGSFRRPECPSKAELPSLCLALAVTRHAGIATQKCYERHWLKGQCLWVVFWPSSRHPRLTRCSNDNRRQGSGKERVLLTQRGREFRAQQHRGTGLSRSVQDLPPAAASFRGETMAPLVAAPVQQQLMDSRVHPMQAVVEPVWFSPFSSQVFRRVLQVAGQVQPAPRIFGWLVAIRRRCSVWLRALSQLANPCWLGTGVGGSCSQQPPCSAPHRPCSPVQLWIFSIMETADFSELAGCQGGLGRAAPIPCRAACSHAQASLRLNHGASAPASASTGISDKKGESSSPLF